MTLELSVKKICGRKIVTRDDGILISEYITEAWDTEEEIVIDFNNIPIASVSFLDQAIGVFALDHDLVEVREKLTWKNMTSFDERLLHDILTSRARQRRNKMKNISKRRKRSRSIRSKNKTTKRSAAKSKTNKKKKSSATG
jgi:hypothetical protein